MITAHFYYVHELKGHIVKHAGKHDQLALTSDDQVWEILRTSQFTSWFRLNVGSGFSSTKWVAMPGAFGLHNQDESESVIVLVMNKNGEEYDRPTSPIGGDEVIVSICEWSSDEPSLNLKLAAFRARAGKL